MYKLPNLLCRFGVRRVPTPLVLSLILVLTAACDGPQRNLAMVSAQPKAPAQRNHTNFYPALQCMDSLFLKVKRPQVMISSNQIPDRTKSIAVDTRGMIITALNHMTRRSKAFVFVEQGLVGRTVGDTLALEKDHPKDGRPPAPRLYINGAISQVDQNARSTSVDVNLSGLTSSGTSLSSTAFDTGIGSSVVTLDLHLVSFPSRLVVQGSAISNSITVTGRTWGNGLVGQISQRTLGLKVEVGSVESQGQAVRSLIELGLIEMLGNYTGVPFWECLSLPQTNAADTARDERDHTREYNTPERLRTAQYTLNLLGYANVQPTGKADAYTRSALATFQAQKGILASGKLDFDTYRALEKARTAMQPKPAKAPRRPARSKIKPTKPVQNDGFQSLQVYVDTTF